MSATPENFEVYDPASKSTLYFGQDEVSARDTYAAAVGLMLFKGFETRSGTAPRTISKAPELAAPYSNPCKTCSSVTAGACAACPDRPEVKALPAPAPSKISKRDDAISAGFTGDACGGCGSMYVVRNGTCTLCRDCGATSGCS